jgi:hypothetical protein
MFVLILTTIVLQGSSTSAGVKVAGDDETYVKIGGLLQAHAAFAEQGAPDGSSVGTEFYLRRMRLMVYGQFTKWVNYFVETDNPNFGKNGDLSMNMFIQDAYLELNLHKAIQIDFGMLLVPFSHHGMQGATSLLALDYHGALLKYPDGSNKVWRDYGIMIRGLLAGGMLEYRVGVFNGAHGDAAITEYGEGAWLGQADPRNPMDLPRLTARVTFNLFEPEGGAGVGGMFYDGIYLDDTDDGLVSPKRVLAIGGSVDWQRELNVRWGELPSGTGMEPPSETRRIAERSDYLAAAGDLFWDIPLGEQRIMSLGGQVNFYYFDHGDRSDGDTYYDAIGSNAYTGIGLMSELGFRYDAFEPLVMFDWYDSTEAATEAQGDYMAVMGGLNYFLFGHSVNFKLQVGGARVDGGDWGVAGTLQGQLLF